MFAENGAEDIASKSMTPHVNELERPVDIGLENPTFFLVKLFLVRNPFNLLPVVINIFNGWSYFDFGTLNLYSR
jgi:hypothetical protein